MKIPDDVQRKLVALHLAAKSKAEFRKLVWANGLQEYLVQPTNDYDRAKQMYRIRKGHRHLAPNSAFDLAMECAKEFNLIKHD